MKISTNFLCSTHVSCELNPQSDIQHRLPLLRRRYTSSLTSANTDPTPSCELRTVPSTTIYARPHPHASRLSQRIRIAITPSPTPILLNPSLLHVNCGATPPLTANQSVTRLVTPWPLTFLTASLCPAIGLDMAFLLAIVAFEVRLVLSLPRLRSKCLILKLLVGFLANHILVVVIAVELDDSDCIDRSAGLVGVGSDCLTHSCELFAKISEFCEVSAYIVIPSRYSCSFGPRSISKLRDLPSQISFKLSHHACALAPLWMRLKISSGIELMMRALTASSSSSRRMFGATPFTSPRFV